MARFRRIISTILVLFYATSSSAGTMLQDMSGQNILFSDLAGKWVLINYWAGWCKTCIEEIPELNHFYENNKNNIAVFAVNYDALPLYRQQKLIKKLDIRYPSLKQDPSTALQLGDIRGLPATFVFNPKGQLSTTLYGGQTVASLNKELHRLGALGSRPNQTPFIR